MTTLKELFDMMERDEKMDKKSWAIRGDDKAIAKFLKKYDCDATVEEAKEYALKYVNEKYSAGSEEELRKVSGGGCGHSVPKYNGHLVVSEYWKPSCNPSRCDPKGALKCGFCNNFVDCSNWPDFKKRFEGTSYTGYCKAQ